jgi:hypothetical protein
MERLTCCNCGEQIAEGDEYVLPEARAMELRDKAPPTPSEARDAPYCVNCAIREYRAARLPFGVLDVAGCPRPRPRARTVGRRGGSESMPTAQSFGRPAAARTS